MTLIVGLLLTAFILFFFEIFLPGGVLAVIGGILLLVAASLTYTEFGLIAAIGVLIGGLVGALTMFFVEIRFISNSRFGNQLSLKQSIDAKVNQQPREKLVGCEGVTLTTLAPSGRVEIDGEVRTAYSEDGFLEKDTPVKVLRSSPFHLIVVRK